MRIPSRSDGIVTPITTFPDKRREIKVKIIGGLSETIEGQIEMRGGV